jgi:coproporphyrinogen III oxidase-like Fe-S oxidoreductase
VDPTFNHNQAHAVDVLGQIHACKLSLQTRPEKVTSAFLQAVESSVAEVVLECGVQTFEPSELGLIERIPGSSAEATVKKVDEKLELMRSRGVDFEVSLIYGLPGQTFSSFMKSFDKARECGASKVEAFPLMLLRGTELHKRREELGLREGFEQSVATARIQDFIPHVVTTPTMTMGEWIRIGEVVAEFEASRG